MFWEVLFVVSSVFNHCILEKLDISMLFVFVAAQTRGQIVFVLTDAAIISFQ